MIQELDLPFACITSPPIQKEYAADTGVRKAESLSLSVFTRLRRSFLACQSNRLIGAGILREKKESIFLTNGEMANHLILPVTAELPIGGLRREIPRRSS